MPSDFLCTRFQRHTNSMFRTQRNRWKQFHWMPRHQPQSPALRDRRQQQRRFHQRELCADANPRPSAKRKICIARELPLKFFRPSLRQESIRLRKKSRIVMRHPRTHSSARSPRNCVASNFHIFRSKSQNRVRRRIQPQRFLDHFLRVRQPRQIFHYRFAAAEYEIQLFVQFFSASGFCASKYHVHESASAVVS